MSSKERAARDERVNKEVVQEVETKQVAVMEPTGVLAKFHQPGAIETLTSLIRENFGATGMNEFDLERVKIPSGGGISWTLPTVDGMESANTFDCVVVDWRDVRRRWATPFTGAGMPPDCSSDDCIKGYGDPGGECAACPFSKFGTATNAAGQQARGQACRMVRLLFVIREGNFLPDLIPLPPTSLKAARNYFLRLASVGKPYYNVITKLGLTPTKNAGGIVYSLASLSLVRSLQPNEVAVVNSIRQAVTPGLRTITLSSEDFQDVAGDQA
jgi:hypothetical protein